MRKLILLASAAAGLVLFNPSAGRAVENTVAAPSPYSQTFIEQAASGNRFEILSSKAALTLASDPDVKEFAQQMIDDHGKAGVQMKAAINEAKKSIIVRDPAEDLSATHQEILDSLKNAPSGTFDYKYIQAQVDAHNETLKLFRNYNANGDSNALKNFTAKTIPTLEMHKRHVDALAAEKFEAN